MEAGAGKKKAKTWVGFGGGVVQRRPKGGNTGETGREGAGLKGLTSREAKRGTKFRFIHEKVKRVTKVGIGRLGKKEGASERARIREFVRGTA